jgi:hypothetical protein
VTVHGFTPSYYQKKRQTTEDVLKKCMDVVNCYHLWLLAAASTIVAGDINFLYLEDED